MNKLSIIIPAYNAERFILDCLNSILNDDFSNFEIIIINDGSTDKTQAIIENISDNRIKLFNNKNHGVSYSRNYGLKKALGDYVMFVDSDDTIKHNSLKKMMNYAKKYKPDIIISQFEEEKSDLMIFENKKINDIIEALIVPNKNYLNSSLLGYSWGKVYSKHVIENIFFDEKIRFKEDTLFNLNAYFNSKKIIIIPDKCYNYVLNENSVSFKFFDNYNKEIMYYLDILKPYVKKSVISMQDYYIFGLYMYMNLLKHNVLHKKNKDKYNFSLRKTLESDQWNEIFKNVNPNLLDKKYKILRFAYNNKMALMIRIMFKLNELRAAYAQNKKNKF